MVVTSCKNKFIILDELKSLLSMRKYDIERLISLFSEYCLCDLNLDESQIEFLKKGNFYGSYSASAGIVRLNMKKNMSSLYELLNTIAHEHKHKKQDVNKEKRFKFPTKGLSSNFPLKNMNALIYTLMLYDEEIDLSSLEFTSDSEKDAREYAIILIDKLINDLSFLEACDNNTNKYFSKFIKYLAVKNQAMKEKEEKYYNIRLGKGKTAYFRVSDRLGYYIKNLFSSIKNKPDYKEGLAIYEYYQNFGSVARIIDAYLSLYSNEKITNYIFSEAEKIADYATIMVCLNHENTNISNVQILKELIFLNNGKEVEYNVVQNQLYSYKDKVVENLYNAYNNLVSPQVKQQYQREFL